MLFCSAVWQLRKELPSVIAKRVNKLWTDALSCEMDTNHQSLIYDQCWRPLLVGQPQQQRQQLENFLASSLHYVIYIFVCFVVLFLPFFFFIRQRRSQYPLTHWQFLDWRLIYCWPLNFMSQTGQLSGCEQLCSTALLLFLLLRPNWAINW